MISEGFYCEGACRDAASQSRFVPSPVERDARSWALATGDWWPQLSNQEARFTAKLLTPNSSTLLPTSSFSLPFIDIRSFHRDVFACFDRADGRRAPERRVTAPVLFWNRTGEVAAASAAVLVGSSGASCIALPCRIFFPLFSWG